jgi:large conductance mechanosensitive channel
VQRLRELMAHGGIAILAVVFALGFATFGMATALASEVVSVLQQRGFDEDGDLPLSFTIDGTTVSYHEILLYAIAVALMALALVVVWALTRRLAQACPECRSSIPVSARICRYSTTELAPADDA